nr:cell division control protein 42 homolog [Onthophagus taurus]
MSTNNNSRRNTIKSRPHKHIRITVVGDGTTGKTCLLICYKDKKFEPYYIPTVFDSYSMTVPIGDHEYTIVLCDTAGQEEYDRLRPLAYTETDVFVVCFAVDNLASLKNVENKWLPEIRHHKPQAKIILTCTKIDLRTDDNIQTADGFAVCKRNKLDDYVECSSKLMRNVNQVFAIAISSYLSPYYAKKQKCLIL